MRSASFLSSIRGSRAAAVLGIAIAAAGAALALVSLLMAAASGSAGWLLLTLPAVGLMELGATVYRARFGSPSGPRTAHPAEVKRSPVQDFAHHNKAWDNVDRWERKYEHGADVEGRIGKPQRKLESWSLRLKR